MLEIAHDEEIVNEMEMRQSHQKLFFKWIPENTRLPLFESEDSWTTKTWESHSDFIYVKYPISCKAKLCADKMLTKSMETRVI